jgi:hypothetical protein
MGQSLHIRVINNIKLKCSDGHAPRMTGHQFEKINVNMTTHKSFMADIADDAHYPPSPCCCDNLFFSWTESILNQHVEVDDGWSPKL